MGLNQPTKDFNPTILQGWAKPNQHTQVLHCCTNRRGATVVSSWDITPSISQFDDHSWISNTMLSCLVEMITRWLVGIRTTCWLVRMTRWCDKSLRVRTTFLPTQWVVPAMQHQYNPITRWWGSHLHIKQPLCFVKAIMILSRRDNILHPPSCRDSLSLHLVHSITNKLHGTWQTLMAPILWHDSSSSFTSH